jgi:prophage DNA circulation protein
MEFLEEVELEAVTHVVDTQTKVLLSAQQVLENQKTVFDRVFEFASLPYSKAQSVTTLVQGAVTDINRARATLGQLDEFAREIGNLGGAVTSLLIDAEQLVEQFINIITFGFLNEDQDLDNQPDAFQSFLELRNLFDYNPPVSSASEESTQFNRMVRVASIAQGAHMLSLAEFESSELATENRNILFVSLDAVLETEDLPDEIFQSLSDLRAQLSLDIDRRAILLPSLLEVTLGEATPALVLSYKLYGDVDAEQSILERNRVEHPAFVPGSIPIRVLTDVG